MTHSKQGRRRWKENRKRREREERKRVRIDERLAQPGFRQQNHGAYTRYLMCTRKHAYPTTERAIEGCLYASYNTGQAFRPYKCPICHQWHITTRTESYA